MKKSLDTHEAPARSGVSAAVVVPHESGSSGGGSGPGHEPAGTHPASSDPDRPATIYDVARAAGVSHQTVSRFLNGYQGIRPATRTKVLDALDALNYRPNLAARSLTTGRSNRIGALTHEIDQVGPSKIIQGASLAAREAGYLLDIVALDMSDRASISESLELLMRQDLAGVLALSSTDEMTEAFSTSSFRVPALIAAEADELPGTHASELTTDGFPALITYLAELGHERFLHIAGPQTWSAARNRRRAFDTSVHARNLTAAPTVFGDWSAKSAYEAVQALPEIPATAIIAANDQMALGAILALTERGLTVPDDISVTGVDDIAEAAYFRPPLTTLRVDFASQGRAAIQELLTQINPAQELDIASVGSDLIIRRSTGPRH
ncbi:LacI family DNA-binding transcriptional regulator [Arthrobacter sp. TMS1-12-1]